MKRQTKLKLYDFSPVSAVMFFVVYAILFGLFIILGFGAGKPTGIGAYIAISILAISFLAIMLFFLLTPVILTRDGVKRGKKFIPASNAKFKEIYDSKYKEQKIAFYDKTITETDGHDFIKNAILVQNVKGYPQKIRKFYSEVTK